MKYTNLKGRKYDLTEVEMVRGGGRITLLYVVVCEGNDFNEFECFRAWTGILIYLV